MKSKPRPGQIEGRYDRLTGLTAELSSKRKATAKKMAVQVEKELASLKMAHTRFSLSVSATF